MMKRYCLVLGASGEIGQSICLQLAAEGWSLVLHYHQNERAINGLQEQLQQLYPQSDFQVIQGDLAKPDCPDIIVQQIRHVAAIVIASGHSVWKLLDDTTRDEWEALWHVHVQSPMRIVGLLAEQQRKFERSYVVFISSIWGQTGAAGEVVYSTVKGAQHAFVKAYAKEAGPSGIRVNALAPGWIQTRMNETFSPEERQMVQDAIPLMTLGVPNDVASLVQYLLSGKADYITGSILPVNGGWYI